MTLRGDVTGNDRIYTDAVAHDPDLVDFASKVTVIGDGGLSDTQVAGTLRRNDGSVVAIAFDLMDPLPPEVLESKLRAKAEAIMANAGTAIWNRFGELSNMTARDVGNLLN